MTEHGISLLVNGAVGETSVALVEAGSPVEIHLFRHLTPRRVGHIHLGIVRKLAPEFDGLFIEIAPGELAFMARRRGRQTLAEGERLIVQVIKEALGGKPVEVSPHISFRGHFLAFQPLAHGVEVSREIGPGDKKALSSFIDLLAEKQGGFRLRSSAGGANLAALQAELEALVADWRAVDHAARASGKPKCLYQGLAPELQFLRDRADESEVDIIFDRPDLLAEARQKLPALSDRMRLFSGVNLFFEFGAEETLAEALSRAVGLPGGGTLIIEETEALTAIDVNAGTGSRQARAADLAFRTNLEAAREIARQLRLRQIGGLVVIDFIDLNSKSEIEELLVEFDRALGRDPNPVRRTGFSAFGLVELTRKRTGPSLSRQLLRHSTPGPSPETAALALLRQAEAAGRACPGRAIGLEADSATAIWLRETGAELLTELARRLGLSHIEITIREGLAPGQGQVHVQS